MNLHVFVANDNGNSAHKMIINGNYISQPNVNCAVDSIPWSEVISPESLIPNLQNQLVVTVKDQMYYVGRFALDSGEVLNNMQVGIDEKHEVDLPLVNTLAQIAAYAVQESYLRTQTVLPAVYVKADMSTCLPVIQYTQESAAKFEGKFMAEEFRVLVHLGRTPVVVDITFDFVKAVPEGTPITFSIQRGTDGGWRSDEMYKEFSQMYSGKLHGLMADGSFFEHKRLLHADIGDGTTEYPVTVGNSFLRQFMSGSNHGAGHALEESLTEFNKLIHIPDSPRQFLSDVVKDPEHKYYDRAMRVLERPLKAQADQISKNIVKQLTKTRNEIDVICIHGGGSILMRPHLYPILKQICDQREIMLFYIPAQYCASLNVEGLDIFCRGKIYEGLKKRAKQGA